MSEHIKKKIGILGATGYTGVELLKLLKRHSSFEIVWLTSESSAGTPVFDMFPQLQAWVAPQNFISAAEALKIPVDGVFSCLPHQAAATLIKPFLDKGQAKVVDLSADFRMKDVAIYEKFYGPHPCPELLEEAIYGLTEWYPEKIATARLVGNPGCYPTTVLVPLAPLLRAGLIQAEGLIADAKSGVSGAGKKPGAGTHYVEVNESFSAYKVADEHRHLSEINEQLSIAAGVDVNILFTPHLLPMSRGILCTIYADLTEGTTEEAIRACLEEYYNGSPFVHLLHEGFPKTGWVRETNRVWVGLKVARELNKLVIVSVEDNLTKGASGQALQNMNLMLGAEPTDGLV